MIATLHRKDSTRARKFPLFDVLDPGAVYADRQVMFLLASNGTGMTSNALTIVDDEPVVHVNSLYRVFPIESRRGARMVSNGAITHRW